MGGVKGRSTRWFGLDMWGRGLIVWGKGCEAFLRKRIGLRKRGVDFVVWKLFRILEYFGSQCQVWGLNGERTGRRCKLVDLVEGKVIRGGGVKLTVIKLEKCCNFPHLFSLFISNYYINIKLRFKTSVDCQAN